MQTPTAAPQTKHRKHLAKKYLPAACSVGLMLALSGCLATEKLDYQLMRQEDAKWVADEQLTDRLIAVGKPSAPIGGVDNAIVLAGEKRSYLVQSTDQDPELTAILNHVDLAYFSLAEGKRLKALMPLAKAFDIITFPIQLIMIGGAN